MAFYYLGGHFTDSNHRQIRTTALTPCYKNGPGICLLSLLPNPPGATGSEVLKNLVLGGVGSFTMIDDAVVAENDLGENFFLTREHLGKSRAASVSQLL